MRRFVLTLSSLLLGGSLIFGAAAQTITLGDRIDSVKFAVIGDNGSGTREQHELGQQMITTRSRFPFEFVLMMGDNLYGGQSATDFVAKFERPYQALISLGVKFYAAIGNHDD